MPALALSSNPRRPVQALAAVATEPKLVAVYVTILNRCGLANELLTVTQENGGISRAIVG